MLRQHTRRTFKFTHGLRCFMRLAVPYGKHFLETEIQEGLEIISSHYVKPIEDIENNLKVKIRKPTGSKPLRDLICRGKMYASFCQTKLEHVLQRKFFQ